MRAQIAQAHPDTVAFGEGDKAAKRRGRFSGDARALVPNTNAHLPVVSDDCDCGDRAGVMQQVVQQFGHCPLQLGTVDFGDDVVRARHHAVKRMHAHRMRQDRVQRLRNKVNAVQCNVLVQALQHFAHPLR